MLDELPLIRALLTTLSPENICIANAELKKQALLLDDIAGSFSAEEQDQSTILECLARLRAEVDVIRLLAQSGSDYFSGLGLLRAAGFGGYERTGALKSLDRSSRTILQL